MRQLVKQKPYHGVMIGLQKVPVTCSIQVYGVTELTTDHLALYFESIEGVDDAEVELFAQNDYAIVHFAHNSGKKFLWMFVYYFLK